MVRTHSWLKRWFIMIIIVLLISSAAVYGWLELQSRAVNPASAESVVFVVRKGQSSRSIAQSLYEKNLIRHPWSFLYLIKRYNLGQKIQAGSFRISPSMDAFSIAKNLTRGTLDVWITILEGWRREEIASAIGKAMTEKGATFHETEFLSATAGKEGYLFPDTYLIPLATHESTIASILENTFNERVVKGLAQDISQSNRSLSQVMIMASLIEREARTDKSRQLISGILWKRLDSDWPLQVDAALQYALGYDKTLKTWWREPLGSDIGSVSPYNTYKNPGLPPGPICSPSLSSIQAALHPTPSEYWFYISDKAGNMHYAATNGEHEANVEKYLR